MELLLIRHGLPVRRELQSGAADPELSAAGHAQAGHLADYLSTEKLDVVYASPMRRAFQTAQPLAANQRLDIVVEDDVAEWDRNSSEYVPVEELKAANDPRWQAMLRGEYANRDETQEQFDSRVVTAIQRIVAAHPGQRVAVVCHGGVINSYLCNVIGITQTAGGFFYPNYTSIHRVIASRGGDRSVVTVNETSHLRGTGLPMGLNQTS
jgi:2,3-bisphosphoglycerate-dependent phosphoglycerate mutase